MIKTKKWDWGELRIFYGNTIESLEKYIYNALVIYEDKQYKFPEEEIWICQYCHNIL